MTLTMSMYIEKVIEKQDNSRNHLYKSALNPLRMDHIILKMANPFPAVEGVCAVMVVWRIREKIIRTVLCCAVYGLSLIHI